MKRIEEFLDTFPEFNKVAYAVLDRTHKSGIKFVRTIDTSKWNEHQNWVYLIVAGGEVVKIGGTKVSIGDRIGKYRSGDQESRDRGTCSTTNYKCAQYIKKSLKIGQEVDIYGYPLKKRFKHINDLDVNKTVLISTFETVEAEVLNAFFFAEGKNPILSVCKQKQQK